MKKFFSLLGLLAGLTLTAQAQSFDARLNKENPKEWGEAVEKTITSDVFQKKNIPGVPLKVQVRFRKKIVMGCQYEYQVTNTSTTQAIAIEGYAVSDQKYDEKIKPGQSVIFLANTMTRCGDKAAKGDEPCMDCQPSFNITKAFPK